MVNVTHVNMYLMKLDFKFIPNQTKTKKYIKF